MIQDGNAVSSSSSNSFFPDMSSKKDVSNVKDDSYEQVMKKTVDSPKKDKAPVAQEATDAQVKKPVAKVNAKMDKPKVGNREPFFPNQAMPYHPQAPVGKPINMDAEMNMQMEEISPSGETQDEQIQSVKQNFSPGMDISKLLREKEVDDQQGVLSQSFEGATATYPVSQIAAQSLDEETKKSLMEQGLWDQQGVYAAKPSPKLLAMMEMTENQKAVPVQKPIAQFMASMENELGVSPDILVQAYSQLAPGSLSQSPMETMKEVIQQLDLSPTDQKRAAQLYSKMLVQLQNMDSPSEQLSPMMMAPAFGKALQVSNQEEQKPVKLVDGKAATQKYSQTMKSLENKSDEAAPVLAVTQEGKVIQSSAKQQSEGFEKNHQQSFSQEMSKPNEAVVKSVKGQTDEVKLDPNGKLDSSSQTPLVDTKHANVKGFEVPGAVAGGAIDGAQLNGAASNREARHEAIQSIINNTQALSHRGGGEMKLTLTPEHLGEIQVKVVTSGSNVDIQMVAEKSEAKKLIEQNIHELRAGLAQHGLSMDKLDVNIGDKSAGFQNQHGKPDFNQAREFAQGFNQSGSSGQRGREREELLASRMSDRSMLQSRTASDALARRGVSSGRLNIVA